MNIGLAGHLASLADGFGRVRIRARPPSGNHRLLFWIALAALALGGCGDEVKPESEKAREAALNDKPDAAPPPNLPAAPIDLLGKLPEPPPGVIARPGDPASTLDATEGIESSDYSPRIRQARFDEGPLSSVTYLLDKGGKRIEAVLVTFSDAYSDSRRRADMFEAARAALQAGQPLDRSRHEGLRWQALGYRVDLRRDTHTDNLELLLHSRGGRTLDLP